MKTTLLHIKLGDMYDDDALAFVHYYLYFRIIDEIEKDI